MELARFELSQAQAKSRFAYGHDLGLRMAREDERGKKRRKVPTVATKRVLTAFPPSERVLSLKSHLNEMREPDIWQSACALAEEEAMLRTKSKKSLGPWCDRLLDPAAAYEWHERPEDTHASEGKTLDLKGWQALRLKPLRSLSLQLGATLTTVDLSETPITDDDIQSLCARLDAVRVLKLSACAKLTNFGIKLVASCCFTTLREINVSYCSRLTSDACGWLAGTLGSGSPGCLRLESLDISHCPDMKDDALFALARGCWKRLRSLTLAHDTQVTDAGVVVLARSCLQLEVLDISGCHSIGDASFIALGSHTKRSSRLKCLIAPAIGPLRTRSIRALAKGCPRLTTLNIAGAKHIKSEAVFGELVTHCRGIKYLNVTGAATVATVVALIQGARMEVRMAKSFLGFVPVEQFAEKTLIVRQHELEEQSSKTITKFLRSIIARKVAKFELERQRHNRATLVITRNLTSYVHRARYRHSWMAKRKNNKADIIARSWRAYRGRCISAKLAEQRQYLVSRTPQAVSIQACFRGFACRKNDEFGVHATLMRSRVLKRKRMRRGAARLIQAVARAHLGRRRYRVLIEIAEREHKDRDAAAHNIQYVVRRMLAVSRVRRKRKARNRSKALLNDAARRITCLFQTLYAKNFLKRLREAEERRLQMLDACARIAQRCTRGLMGRLEAKRRRAHREKRRRSAIHIQRIFRGSRILAWPHLRVNQVAISVFHRRDSEQANSKVGAEIRYASYTSTLGHDSCSEDDASPDEAWIEHYEAYTGRRVFLNTLTGEQTAEDPRALPADTELIGWSVRVYWPRMEEWYQGTLTRFNKRRQKYRLEYDDGDHEWIDFEMAYDRVQIFDANGQWTMLEHASRPALEAQRRAKAELNDRTKLAEALEKDVANWRILEDDSYLGNHAGPQRWYHADTGEVRTLCDDAMFWMESRDDDGLFCFQHGETGERVYDRDPRLMPPQDTPEIGQAKIEVMDKLRLGAYLTSALLEEWSKAKEYKAQRALFKRVLQAKSKLCVFSTDMAQARQLWSEIDFKNDEELAYFAQVLLAGFDLLNQAEQNAENDKIFKRNLIAKSRRSRKISCSECGHQVPHDKTHCIQCGARCTSWGE